MKYRPSNGIEGDLFISAWCDTCVHEQRFRETGEDPCPIVADTFLYQVDEREYPAEWRYEGDKPVCTAYEPEGE